MAAADEPRATILVPSYNYARFVLATVQSALDQTEEAIEVLVIDDGSSDDSVARLSAIDDPRVRVLTQANAGLSRTLNRGLELARGRWVKFLPADDMLAPRCIEKQLAVAGAEPDLTVVFCLPEVVGADGRPLADPAPQAWFDTAARRESEILPDLVERNFLCAPGALFDRATALESGGFDPELIIAQDYDLWLRLLPRCRSRLLAERLVRVRWHGANQSAVVTLQSEAERARVLTRALDLHGLDRWVELFSAPLAGDVGGGKRALAAALVRSGLPAVEPLAERLAAEARAAPAGQARPRDHGADGDGLRFHAWTNRTLQRLAARLRRARVAVRRRLVAMSTAPRVGPGVQSTASPPRLVGSGPRVEHWLVLAPEPADAADRAHGLATALARRGHRVTMATRRSGASPLRSDCAPDARLASGGAPAEGVGRLEWSVGGLRDLVAGQDERLRVLIEAPHAEAVALSLEARRGGARVLYDRTQAWERMLDAAWYEPETERFLIAESDDLIAADRSFAPWLSAGRRLVHCLPSPIAADRQAERRTWDAHAGSLEMLAAVPTVAVVVVSREGCAALRVTLDALAAQRGVAGYRSTVVDAGSSDGTLEMLAPREASGELRVLRSAPASLVAARNLALRATASEIAVFLECGAVPLGTGWLDEAVALLLANAEVGAVVCPAAASPPADSLGGAVAPRQAWREAEILAGPALVLPRSVLARVGAFDESHTSLGDADRDLGARLRRAGYRIALCTALAVDGDADV